MSTHISVGIPFTSVDEHLLLAVRSCLAQTYTNWDLTLVADGTNVSNISKLDQFLNDKVKLVHDGKQLGLANRLNQLTQLAKGEWIARMDADDVMHPNRLSEQIAHVIQSEAASAAPDVIACRAVLIDADNNVKGIYREREIPSTAAGTVMNGFMTHPTIIARRSWMLDNPYDPQRSRTEDKELWLRTFPRSTFHKVEKPLMFYRVPVIQSLQKQQLTAKDDRAFIKSLTPNEISAFGKYKYLVKSRIRQSMFATAHKLNLHEWLFSKKVEPLDPANTEEYQQLLLSI